MSAVHDFCWDPDAVEYAAEFCQGVACCVAVTLDLSQSTYTYMVHITGKFDMSVCTVVYAQPDAMTVYTTCILLSPLDILHRLQQGATSAYCSHTCRKFVYSTYLQKA